MIYKKEMELAPISYWISEKDRGIYDAMNKGILKSNGKFLFFLNSGDLFFDNKVLEKVSKVIEEKKDVGIIYGLAECYSDEENIRYISRGKIIKKSLWKGMPVCHQSMFFRKEVFAKLGLYNIEFKAMADYEFLLRFIYNQGQFKAYYLDYPVCKFSLHGFSSKDYLKNLSEIIKISRKYYNFDIIKKIFFLFRKLKFYLIVLAKKFGLFNIYRKIKYSFLKSN